MKIFNLIRNPGFPVLAAVLLAGCTGSTNVSTQPTAADMQAASQRQAASVDQRTDLTPEQREGLKKYYSKGQGQGQAGGGR